MGRKTHGPYLVAAIEYNDITKVSDILSTKFRDKSKVKHFLVSEVRRLASEYSEVPLLLAATLEDPTILKYFVTKHDVNINHIHEYGFQKPKKRKTALLVAVRRGLYVMVDTILALNGDVNVQDHKGRTPLHHAVRRADYRMAKLLLSRGAQVSINDVSGNSPLHIASIFGHVELVKLLLRHGGDLYKKGQYGAIPIHIAAKEGHASLVRMFCEQCEVNVNIMVPCYDDREKAPLHVAAMEGHSETVFTLLEHCRADVNIRDSEGETPLHCVALREYDPLGMKSKEDFTETVKVLLNYGAEANTRNARGETALHLAARNEFQKVLEVLVLAGTDPLIEDDDKNKAIDLVAPEDTVSKQTLKNAMADRERYMAEALEVRARGFAMNLQNHLPFSNRSQSTMNMPLAGLHNAPSHGRLFPNHGGSTFGSNYFPQGGSSRQVFGGQFHQSSHSHSSSSGSKRRSKESIQSVPKLPPSMLSYEHLPPVPLSAVRKTKSVEELDQVASGRFHPKPGGAAQSGRRKHGRHGRKNSYQESETTSFWSVTPPGSLQEEESDRDSKHSHKHRKARSVPKLVHEKRLVESDEELDDRAKKTKQKKPDVPMKFLPPKDIDSKSLGGEDSDYFLDDDDSVDALEVARHDRKKKAKEPKPFRTQKPAQTALKPGLSSWLDEQAKLVKTKAAPVAHSTPPQSRKTRQNHDDDDDESSSQYSSSSGSESDDTAVPKAAKSKPLPPPKPVKNSVARMGVPVLPSKPLTGSKESLDPRGQRYRSDNPDIERVIQLEVDDSYSPGETLIRVIPVNPAGPSKVHTINQGTSSTTFLRLQSDATGPVSSEQVDINDGQGRKKDRRKPDDRASEVKTKTSAGTPSKSASQDSRGHNKSRNSTDFNLADKDKRPVPKPRESLTSTGLSPGGKKKASHRPEQGSISGSDSFSASSDEAALVTPSSRPSVPGKPSHGLSSPFTQSPKPSSLEQSSNRKPGLLFQKAGATPDDPSALQKPAVESSTLENGKDRSKQSSAKAKASHAKAEAHHLKHAGTNSSSKKDASRKSGSSSLQHESDSNETGSSEEEESESEDEDDVDAKTEETASQDIRTIDLTSDGNMSYTLVGGNVDGVFVHALDRTSEAAKKDLRCGDQILKANHQMMLGRTREEAMQILRSITGPMSLVVRRMPQKYRAAVKNDGMTDLLFVRAHFNNDTTKKGELSVREGDVFCVSDTFPDGNVGFWKAQKVNSKTDETPTGFIPNSAKADQITIKQRLAQGKGAPDQRGGAFLRSFRRAKSADRNGRGQDDEDKLLSSGGVVSYEKVSQRISNVRRPVVVLGLFCDHVVNMLVKDSPDLFEAAGADVENLKDSECPVNVRLIQASMNRGKHCLMILSPPSIEYLQQKTDINPITVYLSPVSKVMVKAVKAKLAPFYNKNTTYMYEEATKFEKNYAHLFSAVVPYTGDDWWFFNLKEAITRIQNQPIFQTVNVDELERRIAAEMNQILPEPITRHPQGQARSGRDRTARMSRTTDDLPVSPVKSESTVSSGVSSVATVGGPRSIMKLQPQQRPPAGSVSSDQVEPVAFHRLHSHNFDETKSGIKKRTPAVTIQVGVFKEQVDVNDLPNGSKLGE